MNIIEAIEDHRFFRPLFRDLRTWKSWFALLRALFGLPIDDAEERRIFESSTSLTVPPSRQAKEAYIVAGRRSGKSFMASIISVFLATFRNWEPHLAPGEKGWIFIIATDREQAKIIKRYISAILNSKPVFRSAVIKDLEWEIELRNNINIAIKTCNFRSIRGYSVLAVICEEFAFWRDENSANPAQEVMAALRPALATIPESMLIGISTPYSRSGVLWDQYRTNFGNENENTPLVWRAPTRIMNPTISNSTIENAMREDPERARAEWEAEWREDVEAFLSLDVIEAAVVPGRFELPKLQDLQYFGFIDPSGGRQDSFTMAICHKEESGRIILDCVREVRPPFSPQNVVIEFAEALESYGVSFIESDKYSGEWVVAEFAKHGITVENAEHSSSEIYINFLPLIMNGSVELLENRRLIDQLRGLERRTRSGGRDLISHGPFSGAHDDMAIAVAGAVVRTMRHEELFSPEFLGELMFPKPRLTREERFNKYVTNWLLDIPQDPWKPEDDMED
jgi:hypothetical protein